MFIELEVWKPVVGYEGFYVVSDHGNVRRVGSNTLMKPRLDNRGRFQVILCVNGKKSGKKVHILVAQAFLGEQPKRSTVEHINGILTDNRWENLRYLLSNQAKPFKTCGSCGESFENNSENFALTGRKGSLKSWCRNCTRKYGKHHFHNMGGRERARELYQLNPEKRLENNRRYFNRHREKKRRYDRLYYLRNKGSFKTANARRKLKFRSLPNSYSSSDWDFALNYFGHKCAVCGKSEDFWTILAGDHWIPLSDPRPDNPGTVPHNMIPLCHPKKGTPSGNVCCNLSKLNKDPLGWLIHRFGKRKAAQINKRVQKFFNIVKER